MKKILLIAGEVSADHHGADLLRSLQKLEPGIRCYGIGGDELESAGMELSYHVRDMAFLGLIEVIRHLPFIRRVHNDLISWCRKEQPDAAILIDYPGFNLRLAASVKKAGIPVLYYISPQIWAWGKNRIRKIQKYVDLMLVLFPFEEKFYAEYGIEAVCVGHPMVDKHAGLLPEKMKTVNPGHIKIGLLPGSRKQEVQALLPKMIETAGILLRENRVQEVEVVRVRHIDESLFRAVLPEGDPAFKLVEGPLNQLLPDYDAVLSKSGTATLEAGYFGVPTVVVYQVNPLTYWLGRLLVRIDYIGLINIVAEKQVAPELIQRDFQSEKAARIIGGMLEPEQNRRIRNELKVLRKKLGPPGASERAAGLIMKFLNRRE